MCDHITKLGNSLIQHGPYNDRIYLMKLCPDDLPEIVVHLEDLALKMGYTKIFAKIPASAHTLFLGNSYTIEAMIPKFYYGREDAFFLTKYFSAKRMLLTDSENMNNVLQAAFLKSKDSHKNMPGPDFSYRMCKPADSPQLVKVFRQVFATYPFPIFDPDYISDAMKNNVRYFGIWHQDLLVAVASAEVDLESSNVEMSDFATLPAFRKKGFSIFLLEIMEGHSRKEGIKTAYSIARSLSLAMNITFSQRGYSYGGTLVNNTNISGNLESMNVWYKSL